MEKYLVKNLWESLPKRKGEIIGVICPSPEYFQIWVNDNLGRRLKNRYKTSHKSNIYFIIDCRYFNVYSDLELGFKLSPTKILWCDKEKRKYLLTKIIRIIKLGHPCILEDETGTIDSQSFLDLFE